MIEIKEETGEIHFFHPLDLVKSYPAMYSDEVYGFKLLSAHICPECKQILDAFYVGKLPIKDENGGGHYTHPYQHKKSASYSPTDPHYTYGHKDGGGFLIMYNHNKTLCKTAVASVVGVENGIKSLIDKKLVVVPTPGQIKTFAEEVSAGKCPGIFLIPDVCGTREPVFAINRKTYANCIEGYTDFDREYKWQIIFSEMVAGVKEAPITQEPTPEPAYVPKAKPVMKTGKRNVYEMIYSRLQTMEIIDETGKMQADYMKFKSGGLMPLHVDNLLTDREGNQMLSLAHNGKQNGDVMADPDMEVRVVHEMKMAEALTFRNDYIGINQVVYPEPGKVYPKLKTELNSFLNSWLKRMIEDQKYVLEFTETDGVETPAQTNDAEDPVIVVTEPVIEPEQEPEHVPERAYNNKEAAYLSCIDNPTVPNELKTNLEFELESEMVELLKEQNEAGKEQTEARKAEQLQNIPAPVPAPVPQVPKTCGECDMWNAFQKPATESTMGVCRNQDSKLFRKMLKKGNVCIMKEVIQLEKQYDTVYLIKNIEGDFLGYDGEWIKELNNKSNPTKFYSDFKWIYNANPDVPDIVYCKARYDPVRDLLDNVERLSTEACLSLLGRI